MIDGSLLKYYREKENLTIKDLSKKMHVPKRIIENWENGISIPRESDIKILCELYGIEKEDLVIEEKSIKNIIISIILFVCGITVGLIVDDNSIAIVLPIILVVILNISLIIKVNYDISKEDNGPKSLFGIMLEENNKKSRCKYYLLESIILSASYILINIVCKMLDFTRFIIDIDIIDNRVVNAILIWLITFVLLTFLAFLIEFVFGEFMVKKYYGGYHE